MVADPGCSLIERAMEFAERAHGAIGHKRKYTGEPYTTHLKAVADLVEEVSGSPEMVAAAWLHDSVEDTAATIEDVTAGFGAVVAALVSALTDVSRLEDGNRAARKAMDRAHLAKASPQAKTVKLADLIDNALSIEQHDARFARTFMREMRQLLGVLQDGDAALYAKADEIVRRYFGG